MRFYKNQHKYYCGIDLHSSKMYVCIVDSAGKTLLHRNMKASPEAFLQAVSRYRGELVVAVESMFCWYWLADVCAREGIEFVLGHALYMKAIHGGKAKNDRIDSEKIAGLVRGGMLPQAYVYPREMRATRDLMRRRLFFVQKRAELLGHVGMTHQQYNLPVPSNKLTYAANREKYDRPLGDDSAKRSIEADLVMIEHYTKEIRRLDDFIEKATKKKPFAALQMSLLQTVGGIGEVLSQTMLYEIHDINRFPTVQQFSSYARLIKPKKTSAGKSAGGGGGKIGNAHLKWAFSEAATLYLRNSERGKVYQKRLQRKHSKARTMSILVHKLGRAVYFMLKNNAPFDEDKFLKE